MLTRAQKIERIVRAHSHAAADRLIAGTYTANWSGGIKKGCSVGCDAIDILGWDVASSYSGDLHMQVANHDGTSYWLEMLRDNVFESVSEGNRSWWHTTLAENLPVDVNLDQYATEICAELIDAVIGMEATFTPIYRGAVRELLFKASKYYRLGASNGKDECDETNALAAAADTLAREISSAAEKSCKDYGNTVETVWQVYNMVSEEPTRAAYMTDILHARSDYDSETRSESETDAESRFNSFSFDVIARFSDACVANPGSYISVADLLSHANKSIHGLESALHDAWYAADEGDYQDANQLKRMIEETERPLRRAQIQMATAKSLLTVGE